MGGEKLAKILAYLISVDVALETLERIRFENCKWDNEESCQQLARFLARARELHTCEIIDQQGEQQIEVAQNLRLGFISINNNDTGNEICRTITSRTRMV